MKEYTEVKLSLGTNHVHVNSFHFDQSPRLDSNSRSGTDWLPGMFSSPLQSRSSSCSDENCRTDGDDCKEKLAVVKPVPAPVCAARTRHSDSDDRRPLSRIDQHLEFLRVQKFPSLSSLPQSRPCHNVVCAIDKHLKKKK